MTDQSTVEAEGGPAFPHGDATGIAVSNASPMGMTMRQWFAGQALAGFCAKPGGAGVMPRGHERSIADTTAMRCYEMADAMLAFARLPSHDCARDGHYYGEVRESDTCVFCGMAGDDRLTEQETHQ